MIKTSNTICPPSQIDDHLYHIFKSFLKKYPGITRSDIIRWGVASLKDYPDLHYEPRQKPMLRKSPSFVISEHDFLYLQERSRNLGVTVSQCVRDAIYAASLNH